MKKITAKRLQKINSILGIISLIMLVSVFFIDIRFKPILIRLVVTSIIIENMIYVAIVNKLKKKIEENAKD